MSGKTAGSRRGSCQGGRRFLAEPVVLRLSFVRFLKSRHEHRRLSDTITSNRISPHGLQRTDRTKSTNVKSELHTWPSETRTSNPHTDRKSSSQFQTFSLRGLNTTQDADTVKAKPGNQQTGKSKECQHTECTAQTLACSCPQPCVAFSLKSAARSSMQVPVCIVPPNPYDRTD